MADQSIQNIVHKAERAINAVINNNIPPETCKEKKMIAAMRKEKVVKELIVRLSSVGPGQIK